MGTTAFLTFLSACVVLAVAPGPGMLYVLTRSLAGGRREGVQSSLGTFAGGLVHVVAAGFGLSAVLATSAVAYRGVKYAGAAYLVYLGIRMIRTAGAEQREAEIATGGSGSRRPFLQGVVTEALNPKTALFFLSFIPQFVDPHAGPALAQFLALGTISVTLNTAADLIVVAFAGPIGERLLASRRARRNQRAATGCAMVGLGLYVAAREA